LRTILAGRIADEGTSSIDCPCRPKAVIGALSTATPKSAVLATLAKAKNAAILNLSSGGALNEARTNVGIALSNLIHDHGPPTPQIIEKAKRAIEAWIWELEASPAA
jgi:hypothetical protein